MFLRSTKRKKDGKEHRYFSVVENVRVAGRRHPYQKTLLYLGEINDTQQSAWIKAISPTSRIRACKTRNLLQIKAPTLKVCTTPTHLADACAAVIFGGGCAGNCSFNFSSNNCWSGSGCV
jgi:hypothetical protein